MCGMNYQSTSVGAAGRMADSTTLLSVCDTVHLVLVKTTPAADTCLVSSHFLDWRQVLTSADSRCTINVELMGIGQYSTYTQTHVYMVAQNNWSKCIWLATS